MFSSPCRSLQSHSIQNFFSNQILRELFGRPGMATMSSFIDSTNVTRWWWKVHKRWSSLKSGVKKRIHSKKGLGTYCGLFWNFGLCVKVLAAAAKSDQKSVNLQNSHKSQYFKGHFLSMMIFHAK